MILLALRLLALLGVLAYFLELEKRSERKVVHNSRAIVLVDTSLSMGLHDSDSSSVPATPNRLEQVVAALDAGGLITKLRESNDVILARFDTDVSRIVSLARLPQVPAGQAPGAGAAGRNGARRQGNFRRRGSRCTRIGRRGGRLEASPRPARD